MKYSLKKTRSLLEWYGAGAGSTADSNVMGRSAGSSTQPYFQYSILPLSFDLQQKGNSTKLDLEEFPIIIGDFVTGTCFFDKKKHKGKILSFYREEGSTDIKHVNILDDDTREILPLDPDTVRKYEKAPVPLSRVLHESLDEFFNDADPYNDFYPENSIVDSNEMTVNWIEDNLYFSEPYEVTSKGIILKGNIRFKNNFEYFPNYLNIIKHQNGEIYLNSSKLKSLQGLPYSCDKLKLHNLENLDSLKGLPKEMNEFTIDFLPALKSLDAPINAKVIIIFNTPISKLDNLPNNCDYLYLSCLFNLKDLENCPEYCKNFLCDNCRNIDSLKGCPKSVSQVFELRNLEITNLEYFPDDVKICYLKNLKNLTSLKGMKDSVLTFSLYNAENIYSCEGMSSEVDYVELLSCKNLRDLTGIPKSIRNIRISRNYYIDKNKDIEDYLKTLDMPLYKVNISIVP